MITLQPLILQPMEYKSKVNRKETKEEHIQRIKKALSYNGKLMYHSRIRLRDFHKEQKLLKKMLSDNIRESYSLANNIIEGLDPRGARLLTLHYEREGIINRMNYNKQSILLQSTHMIRMKHEQKRLNREYNKKFKRFYGNL